VSVVTEAKPQARVPAGSKPASVAVDAHETERAHDTITLR